MVIRNVRKVSLTVFFALATFICSLSKLMMRTMKMLRDSWLIGVLLLCMSGSATRAQQVAGDNPDHPQLTNSDIKFPNFSREDQTNVCLFDYGIENSSIIDCVARDKNYGSALSKIWPDIEDRFKQDCLIRLTDRHLNSYFYLDRCIRSLEHDVATPE